MEEGVVKVLTTQAYAVTQSASPTDRGGRGAGGGGCVNILTTQAHDATQMASSTDRGGGKGCKS